MPEEYHHEVDLLLSCACIAYETIEAAIFIPKIGEARYCSKHKQAVSIIRVGYPYRVEYKVVEKEKETQKQKG